MKDLMNRSILYVLCLILFFQNWFSRSAIAMGLVILSLFCLSSCFSQLKYRSIIILLYGLLSVSFLPMTCFLPLFFYEFDVVHKKDTIPFLLLTGISCFSLWSTPPVLFCSVMVLTAAACLLRYYKEEIQQTTERFHKYRDDSVESSLYMKEKHNAVLAQQDYEIHVATLSERNRIAREIHDNVGHLLTSSILQTGALQVINKDPLLEAPLNDLSDTLNTAMTSVRNSVHDLHDESLDMRRTILQILNSVTGLETELEYEITREPSKEIRYAFVAISKEAVNNTQKHSNATKIKIRIHEHPGFYQLNIADNGVNTAPVREKGGIGLANMRERVENLGGNIHFSAENGFHIFISILKGVRQ